MQSQTEVQFQQCDNRDTDRHSAVFSHRRLCVSVLQFQEFQWGRRLMIETIAPNDIVRRGNETILVVDDEDMVRDAMRLLLECHGYTVLDANGGNEALRLCRNHQGQIALTIIDRRMQPMSGEETLSRLRAIAPELKVILSSGDDQTVQLHDIESAGVAAVLPKPFLLEEFWNVMRHTLEPPAFAAADQSI